MILLVLLHLSRAFDIVDHETLLAVLHFIAFSAEALYFLVCYLRDRFQLVRLIGVESNLIYFTCGVPQGFILGPLLLYICTSSKVQMTICSRIESYYSRHGLVVNPTKSKLRLFVKKTDCDVMKRFLSLSIGGDCNTGCI